MKKARIIKLIIFGLLFFIGLILYFTPDGVGIRFDHNFLGQKVYASLFGNELRMIILGLILIITSIIGLFKEFFPNKKE